MKKFMLFFVIFCMVCMVGEMAYADSDKILNPDNGHYYQRFDNTMTWHDAKAYCERIGGYLATVTSKAENDFVYNKLASLSPYEMVWIGATDEAEEGAWEWMGGEDWDYTNWPGDEPNNCSGIEHYLVYFTPQDPLGRAGFWNDLGTGNNGGCGCDGCTYEWYSMSLICEWEGSPIANAGTDQVVFEEVTLDGSQSHDPNGTIESYEWVLHHREDSAYDRAAEGVNPVVSNVQPGFYDVVLTVTDDDDVQGTDTMLLAVAGPCKEAWPQPNTNINLGRFNITKFKRINRTITGMFGTIDLPDLNLYDGDTVESRITVELFGALPNGSDLVMSEEATLTVRDRRNILMIRK